MLLTKDSAWNQCQNPVLITAIVSKDCGRDVNWSPQIAVALVELSRTTLQVKK